MRNERAGCTLYDGISLERAGSMEQEMPGIDGGSQGFADRAGNRSSVEAALFPSRPNSVAVNPCKEENFFNRLNSARYVRLHSHLLVSQT